MLHFLNVCKTRKDNNCLPHVNIVIPNFWLTLKNLAIYRVRRDRQKAQSQSGLQLNFPALSKFHCSNPMSLLPLLVLSVQPYS